MAEGPGVAGRSCGPGLSAWPQPFASCAKDMPFSGCGGLGCGVRWWYGRARALPIGRPIARPAPGCASSLTTSGAAPRCAWDRGRRYLPAWCWLPKLPHDPEDDPLLPLRQAGALPEYGVRGIVGQGVERLLVEDRGSLPRSTRYEGSTPNTAASAVTCPTVGSAILPVLMPSTSSSARTPVLMRATSAFV